MVADPARQPGARTTADTGPAPATDPRPGPATDRVVDHASDLIEAVLAISEQTDLERVLEQVVDRARSLLGARYAALGVPDTSGERLETFVTSGMSDAEVAAVGPPPTGGGLLGIMLREGGPLRVADIAAHPRSVGFPPGHPTMRRLLGVPIRHGPHVIGQLYVADPHDGRHFHDLDQALLEMLARHAALAIHNAHLLALAASSERRYRLLVEAGPEIVFSLDADGVITYLNERARAVTGYPVERLVGRALRDVVRTGDRPVVDLQLRAVRAGAPRAAFPASTVARDGTDRHFEISLVPSGLGDGGFQGVARDVTERRTREREMAERASELLKTRDERERLREFVSLVMQAQEEERARIAGDLHDTAVQTLTAIGRRLRALAESPGGPVSEHAAELEDLAAAALHEAEEMRRLSRNLRPSALDHLGLAAALRVLADDVEAHGVTVRLDVEGDAAGLADRERTALFRIAQEALTNVRRHGGASAARVLLRVAESEVTLLVADNGRGFDAGGMSRGGSLRSPKLGLAGMRERAAMLGGSLQVDSAPGRGTRVTVRLPLDR